MSRILAALSLTLFMTQPLRAERFILESDQLEGVAEEVVKAKGRVEHRMQHMDALVVDLPAGAVKALKKKFPTLNASEDIVMSINAKAAPTPPPPQGTPWGVAAIHAPSAFAVTRGEGVKVCIIDTGIDKTHPDLSANIVGGRNFVVIKGRITATNFNDDNGHGSHVAGTIAALDNSIGVVGVAPSAKLYAVKALDSRGSGYVSAIADGILHCIAAGTQVINMSLGANGDPNLSSPLKSAVDAALAAGIVVVAAAGNEGADISGKIPAGYAGVIAVSAVDSNMQVPTWSNFGLQDDDYAAPGVAIKSTWKSGGYNTISGTSMAAPHVAGVVALAIAAGSLNIVADPGVFSVYSLSQHGQGLVDALLSVSP